MEQISKLYQNKLFVNIQNSQKFIQLTQNALVENNRSSPIALFYVYLGSLYFACSDKIYLKALEKANVVYLDGFLIGWFLKLLFNKKVYRFGAEDYLYEILKYCEIHNKKVFLLGSDNTNLGNRGAVTQIQRIYPHLKIQGYHGYFTNSQIPLKKIVQFQTDLLIVGLGLDTQEKWIFQNQEKLIKVKVIIAVGNFIDVLGGKANLPPAMLKKYNLRWVYRIVKEPQRLNKRYIIGFLNLILLVVYTLIVKIKNQYHRYV